MAKEFQNKTFNLIELIDTRKKNGTIIRLKNRFLAPKLQLPSKIWDILDNFDLEL